jgi:hypothetical protein
MVTPDRVRLRMAQFTANVIGTPVPPNFTVGSLPSPFISAGIKPPIRPISTGYRELAAWPTETPFR